MTDFNITIEELKPYCAGFNDKELDQARQICIEYRLTPVKRQIHIQKRWTKNGDVISPLVTIDGLRGIAERSDKYAGQVGPFWCGEDGKWSDVWLKATPPLAAKVGVYKNSFKDALYSVAKFEEYCQLSKEGKATGLWVKMPDLMIAKCAEALALRRAFPDELGGLYTKEEMEQADNPKVVAGAKNQNDVDVGHALGGPIASHLGEDEQKAMYDQALISLGGCMDMDGLKKVWANLWKGKRAFTPEQFSDIQDKYEECKAQMNEVVNG